jgi:outer membrane protein OmpA-like peptidoglycan-associated protein
VVLAVAKVNLPAVALFDFDKAELKAAGLIKLDRLLIDHKGAQLDIVIALEQTALVRNDANNQALSLARAKTVKAYLVSKGADVKRMRAVDIGEGRSVAETHTN